MKISELLSKYGPGVEVNCSPGWPTIKVLRQMPNDELEVQYEDGKIVYILDCLDDYYKEDRA